MLSEPKPTFPPFNAFCTAGLVSHSLWWCSRHPLNETLVPASGVLENTAKQYYMLDYSDAHPEPHFTRTWNSPTLAQGESSCESKKCLMLSPSCLLACFHPEPLDAFSWEKEDSACCPNLAACWSVFPPKA